MSEFDTWCLRTTVVIGLPCTISLGGGDFAVLADEFLHKAFSAWCAAVTCYVNTAILVDADRVGENLV